MEMPKAERQARARKTVIGMLIALCLIALCVTLYIVLSNRAENERAKAFDAEMRACVSGERDREEIKQATKMIAYNVTENLYTKEYVPGSLLAKTPVEVRYILKYKLYHDHVGSYGFIDAYQCMCKLTLHDLHTGQDTDVATTFSGPEPPNMVRLRLADYYGKPPKPQPIMDWIYGAFARYQFQNAMRQAFLEDGATPAGKGEKLIILDIAEDAQTFTHKITILNQKDVNSLLSFTASKSATLKNEYQALEPEEVGAIVRLTVTDGVKVNTRGQYYLVEFLYPDTLLPIENLSVYFDRKENDTTALAVMAWIEDTWNTRLKQDGHT